MTARPLFPAAPTLRKHKHTHIHTHTPLPPANTNTHSSPTQTAPLRKHALAGTQTHTFSLFPNSSFAPGPPWAPQIHTSLRGPPGLRRAPLRAFCARRSKRGGLSTGSSDANLRDYVKHFGTLPGSRLPSPPKYSPAHPPAVCKPRRTPSSLSALAPR